jgi:hypothetical protein
MRNQVTKIALAATLVSALIGAAPASAQQSRLANELPTANHAQAKQNYDYGRGLLHSQGSGYQDPWGHWGSYYGPMIH